MKYMGSLFSTGALISGHETVLKSNSKSNYFQAIARRLIIALVLKGHQFTVSM